MSASTGPLLNSVRKRGSEAPLPHHIRIPAGPAGQPACCWRWVLAAAVTAAAVAGGGFAVAATASEDPAARALGPGEVTVELHVEHSLFEPTGIRVVEGTRLRFVVDNDDPINHELIVGGPEVHARHAQGTEAKHPSIPGEVSVGPNEMGVTTLRFDEPGTFEFACHLPGHYEYGMHGVVEVVPDVR
jgi:uncharacterized cupredoxin-like copper-binding protein